MTVKEKSNNSTNLVPMFKPTHTFYKVEINNMTTTHSLELTVIPYTVNQPTDPQLQYGNFYPISIFGMSEYLKDNTKNIMCSLFRIMAFIRQYKL